MHTRYTIRELTDEVKKLSEDLAPTLSVAGVDGKKVKEILASLNTMLARQDAMIYENQITIEPVPTLAESISKKEIKDILAWAETVAPKIKSFMPATELEEKKIAEKEERKRAEEKAEKDLAAKVVVAETKKWEPKVETPKATPVEEKKADRSIELMKLAEQMPAKYKELTSTAKRGFGRIPVVKKLVVSHAPKIAALLKELKSLEADPSQTRFQKQVECLLNHFEMQNIAYNVSNREKKKSKLGAGLFKSSKKHEDNLPAELNRYKDKHHYSRMLATILKTMAENYGDELEPKTLAKINLLVSNVERKDYFIRTDVWKEYRKPR